MAVELTDSI